MIFQNPGPTTAIYQVDIQRQMFLLWDPHWPLGSSLMISLEAIALESGTIIQSFKYCDSELSWYALFIPNLSKPPFCSGLTSEDVLNFLCFHGTDVWIILSGSAFIRLPSDIGFGSKCWDFFEFYCHLLGLQARSRFRGFGRTLSIYSIPPITQCAKTPMGRSQDSFFQQSLRRASLCLVSSIQ